MCYYKGVNNLNFCNMVELALSNYAAKINQ